MRENPITMPPYGTPKPYIINLPNANANDLAASLDAFCKYTEQMWSKVIIAALWEYLRAHEQEY